MGEAIAFAVEVPLLNNEFRVAVAMALTALDPNPNDSRESRRYFDSREALCLAIGRRVVDRRRVDATPEELKERESAEKAVQEALRGLIAVSAIKQVKHGRAGQRAEFYIAFDLAAARQTKAFADRRRAADRKRERASTSLLRNRRQSADRPTAEPPAQGEDCPPARAPAQPEDAPPAQPEDAPPAQPEDAPPAQPEDGPRPKEQQRNNRGATEGNTSPYSTTSLGPVDNDEEAA